MSEIPTPKLCELLQAEFLVPLNLNAATLAVAIGVPSSQIQEVLQGQPLTADLGIRLARYFGMSDSYFLDLQLDIELRNAIATHRDDYAAIKQRHTP